MRDSERKLECLPPPPNEFAAVSVPSGSLGDIALRVAGLSDALYDPNGALAQVEKRIEERATKRHAELVSALTTVVNAVLEIKAILQAKQ